MPIPASIAAALSVLLMISAQPAAAMHHPEHGHACGEGPYYVCGEILVILEEPSSDGIDGVIGRQGGNPDSDLLDQFRGVRDLLAPVDSAVDMSPTIVYIVAVPVGQEQASAEAYAAHDAVYAAGVNRETIGILTPDTALPPPAPLPWPGLSVTCIGVSFAFLTLRRVITRRPR